MFGLPTPLSRIIERRFNARQVQAAGAGLMGELPDFNAAWLNNALFQRAQCAARATILAERIRSYGGAEAAVQAIADRI